MTADDGRATVRPERVEGLINMTADDGRATVRPERVEGLINMTADDGRATVRPERVGGLINMTADDGRATVRPERFEGLINMTAMMVVPRSVLNVLMVFGLLNTESGDSIKISQDSRTLYQQIKRNIVFRLHITCTSTGNIHGQICFQIYRVTMRA
jgi:hypothetical protein